MKKRQTRQEKEQQFYKDAFQIIYGKHYGDNAFDKIMEEAKVNEHWFDGYEWSTDEELQFKEWFITEFSKRFRLSKAIAKKDYSWFFLMYTPKIVKQYDRKEYLLQEHGIID